MFEFFARYGVVIAIIVTFIFAFFGTRYWKRTHRHFYGGMAGELRSAQARADKKLDRIIRNVW